MLSQDQFNQYAAQGYNRIPLAREVLADLETPLSTFLKLANRPFCYLFESVQGGEKWGRYSIIGLTCARRLEVRGDTLRVFARDGARDTLLEEKQCADPLAEVRDFHARFKAPELDALPRFTGGLVGFFGYDTVRHIEPHLGANPNPNPVDAPDILLMASERVVVFDNLSGRLFVIHYADAEVEGAYAAARRALHQVIDELQKPMPSPSQPAPRASRAADPVASFPREDYERAVEKCRALIRAGDIFQCVISQRLALPFDAAPLDLYRALRTLNPSPYMYYLHLDDFHIVGSSPEILTRLEGNEITLRPIAGTRPRGADAAHDAALAEELLADPKELAEHVMLIDLGRNDVGRVAEVGSVKVTEQMTIEKYSHVMHIVSNVVGKIKPDLDAIDVLRATFPAGTLSGAPKVRAMEIIEELEPDKRGVYSGAVGYIGWNGNMDMAIAIRTAVIKNRTLYTQAGGGVVADSKPANEWEEAMNKSRAVLKAAAMASAGLARPLDED